jgi:dTMP kinase
MTKAAGIFVTFEGGDGAGKTTLIEAVYKRLVEQGKAVLKTRAPGATSLGEKIRALLLGHLEGPVTARAELFLFLADRAEHVETVILPALKRGEIVLCDRFNDSTIAYQGVGRGLGKERVTALCDFASQGVTPDLTFYLDIDPRIGLGRVAKLSKERIKDRIETEALSFHAEIRAAFLALVKEEVQRFCLLDASLSQGKVLEQAWERIEDLVF